MSRVREVLVAVTAALSPGHRGRARRARKERLVTEVLEADCVALQSRADLARARAAARNLSGMSDSRVASELARNLRGQS